MGEVLARPKFDRYLPGASRDEFLLALTRVSEFVVPSMSVADCRDPKGDKFLELALEARAAVIVSGDAHLLEMEPY